MVKAVTFSPGFQNGYMDDVYSGNTATRVADSEQVFEEVFKTHFKSLHAYAITLLNNVWEAEEIVQQVFYKLWEKNPTIDISVKAYLYRAVHNDCLNHLKHKKVRAKHAQHTLVANKDIETNDPGQVLGGGELQQKISLALDELPEQCRAVFQLSRFNELKYHEIATELNISIKTVEAQMSKALKRLRLKLADYLPTLIPAFIYLLNILS